MSGDFRHGKLRACLVIAEVGLSLVLLIASGLMMRTMFSLERAEPWFRPEERTVRTITSSEELRFARAEELISEERS